MPGFADPAASPANLGSEKVFAGLKRVNQSRRHGSNYSSAQTVLYDKRAKFEKTTFFKREHFMHNDAADTHTCPAGNTQQRKGKGKGKGKGILVGSRPANSASLAALR